MARKITDQAIEAFLKGEVFRSGNTQINKRIGGMEMLLFGNIIATNISGDGLVITNAGWKTNTTKERLNSLPGVSINQKAGKWYLNGKEWDGKPIKVS